MPFSYLIHPCVGDLKLLDFPTEKKIELYDLATNPGESRNLAQERPADRDRLLARLNEWRTNISVSMQPKDKESEEVIPCVHTIS